MIDSLLRQMPVGFWTWLRVCFCRFLVHFYGENPWLHVIGLVGMASAASRRAKANCSAPAGEFDRAVPQTSPSGGTDFEAANVTEFRTTKIGVMSLPVLIWCRPQKYYRVFFYSEMPSTEK
jgi:hypothetical protein